jgi:hypothetical protein
VASLGSALGAVGAVAQTPPPDHYLVIAETDDAPALQLPSVTAGLRSFDDVSAAFDGDRKKVAALEKRLAEQDMAIELTPAAKKLLSERGYDPALGARPLRRVIQRDIEDSLSEKLLFGDLNPGSIVVVDVTGEDKEREFSFSLARRPSGRRRRAPPWGLRSMM